ncbi:MAG: glycosyltransferase [Cyanobacteria bacterium P01_G01_bin.54]
MLSPSKTKQLFQSGNYTQVALLGNPITWEKYAAFALIGKTSEAIAYFQEHDYVINAKFYGGVAHWLNGNDELAAQLLENVPTAHAQNLLKLIQQKKITVLAQVPWIRNHFTDWLAGVENDPKFQINNISFHPDDIPNEPYADVHQFYDSHKPPDFYICQMVEWHLIPPNLQELPCPIFGQTADYDLHIQAVYPWLQLFDELIVTDGTEWQDVSNLVSVPVSTFPKTFCLPRIVPALELKPRPIDLYLSGTVTHLYHPDKAYLLSQIIRVPELNIRVVNGFMSSEEYYENLSNSKVCFTYVRHSGATPTRGLEALSLGCGLVTQKGSTLTLFAGEQEGVRTYSYDRDDLTENLVYIAQHWADYQGKAHRGAKVVRREFSTEKVASQFLRYLTFLAAKPAVARQRRKVDQSRLVQKRTVLQKGWLPCYDFRQSKILDKIGQENLSRLDDIEALGVASSAIAINKIREIALLNYHRSIKGFYSKAWLKNIEEICKSAIATFPQSLVLRFNLFRLLVHLGEPFQVSRTISAATEIIRQPPQYWSVDFCDDVLPYDIFGDYFNYRAYFDCLVKCRGLEQNERKYKLVQLILASIHYYLGLYTQDSTHFVAAIELDPSFAKYRLSYLKKEIKEGIDLEQDSNSKSLLVDLSQGSTVFLEAHKMIHDQALAKKMDVNQFLGFESQPISTSVQAIESDSSELLCPSIEILVNPLKHRAFVKMLMFKYIETLRKFITEPILRFVRHALDVPEYDLVPFVVGAKTRPDALRQRINAMRSSKFLCVYYLFVRDKTNSLNDLDNEKLVAKIRELEATPAWQLRVRWLKLKLGFKQYLLRLKNAYLYRRTGFYAAQPILIISTKYYNLVIWRRNYYGVPKSLGTIDLCQTSLDNILVETSFQKLKQRIKPLQRSISLRLIEEETKPYSPPSDLIPKDLWERILAMRSSKFLLFEKKSLDPYNDYKDSELVSTDSLLAEIRRLEKTPAWRLRIAWLRLKWTILRMM